MKIIQKTIKPNATHVELDINSLAIGLRTPFDIFIRKDINYVIIVEVGTLINEHVHNLLSNKKTLYVLKSDQSKLTLDCSSLESYIEFNKDLHEQTIRLLYKVMSEQFANMDDNLVDKLNTTCFESIARSIVFLVTHNNHYLKESIQFFSHQYKLEMHSLHVAIYAVNLGYHLKFNKDELLELAIAGLFHDIGSTKINKTILYKTEELNEEDIKIIQKHTKFGIDLVEHNNIHNPYILDAIRHHHERYDGSGYPHGLVAHQMKKHASVLAICDVFDAMTNERPHRKKYTYFDALMFLLKDPSTRNKFNDNYLKVLLKSLI